MPDRAGMPSTGSASMTTSWWRKATVKTRPSAKVSSKRPVLPPTGNRRPRAQLLDGGTCHPGHVRGSHQGDRTPGLTGRGLDQQGPGEQVGRIGDRRRPRVLVAPEQVVRQWQSHPGVEVLQLHRETLRQRNRSARSGRVIGTHGQAVRARAASSSCSSRASSRASTVALTFCCPEDSSTRTVRVGVPSGNEGRGRLRLAGCTRPPEAKP